MKFSEMKYDRPVFDEFKEEAEKIIDGFSKAESFEKADDEFLRWDKLSGHIETMMSLAYTRNSLDTADEFYENEVEYINETSPKFIELEQSFKKKLVSSPFRRQLEEKYGSLLFLNAEISLESFSPEIIPELQETNKLETEYQKLLASAQIDFEGEKRNIPEMHPFKQSADDTVRRAAWRAEGEFYNSCGIKLDEIYDKMVKLRTKMARKLGYDNFVKLGYLQMDRNCYGPEDIAGFRNAVVKYIVPLADRLFREQAKRTGFDYPLSFADSSLKFRDGNADPVGTADDILRTGRELYHELSPETAEFIDVMNSCELMDVLSKKGKAGGGYCTSFPDYKLPFIFANFNGTADDVEVITHEAGHAFAFYTARDLVPSANQSPTLEACEIHSMTMEFFGWRKSDEFFGDGAKKFRYSHLSGAIMFIPYGTMVDHFQHIVYENPEMTPAQRHEQWVKLMKIYMPWMKLDGSPFYGEGKGWQRQIHIYENPFYYIDYCLAQTVALEFWVLMQHDGEKAWEQYMKLVKKAGTQTYTGLVETAGLKSPFDEEALREVAVTAVRWLDENRI